MRALSLAAFAAVLLACGNAPECGPSRALVRHVIDGDTLEIDSGQRVRLLLVDTPELHPLECHAEVARAATESLVAGKEVGLTYSDRCEDHYGRLLAYVSVGTIDVNAHLLERGHACLLFIPPAGNERLEAYRATAEEGHRFARGLWSSCGPDPCKADHD